MITGIGTDIIELERVERSLSKYGDKFRNRVFTPDEQAYCDSYKHPLERYAARWAAKESAVKALGTGFVQGIRWIDIAVLHHPSGQPLLLLTDRAAEIAKSQGVRSAHVSLSHGRDHATATVVLADDPANEQAARFDPFGGIQQ